MKTCSLESVFDEYTFLLLDTSFFSDIELFDRTADVRAYTRLPKLQSLIEDNIFYWERLRGLVQQHRATYITELVKAELDIFSKHFPQVFKFYSRKYNRDTSRKFAIPRGDTPRAQRIANLRKEKRAHEEPPSRKNPYPPSLQALQKAGESFQKLTDNFPIYYHPQNIPSYLQYNLSLTDADLALTLVEHLKDHPSENGAILTRDWGIYKFYRNQLGQQPLDGRYNLLLRGDVLVFHSFSKQNETISLSRIMPEK